MKKILLCVLIICLGLVLGATYIEGSNSVTISSAVTNTLDGSTADRTYQYSDRNTDNLIRMDRKADAIAVHAYCTANSTSDAVEFKVWGYPKNGPAELLYDGTGTCGTAVAGSGLRYVSTYSTNSADRKPSVGISNSGNNLVARIILDTTGIEAVVFEPGTFTSISDVTFVIRKYGYASLNNSIY